MTVTDIDGALADWLVDMLGGEFPAVDLAIAGDEDLAGFDLVVNASPVGMDGIDELPIRASAIATIRHDALVADLVTKPAMTRFLRLGEQGGRVIQQGLEMAAGQMEALGRFVRCLP